MCGHRNEKQQNRAYRLGNSKKKWPDSRHNQKPSTAVDLAPYYPEKPHWRWKKKEDFCLLAGWVLAVARQMGIKITWGGFWRMRDLGHFQLEEAS